MIQFYRCRETRKAIEVWSKEAQWPRWFAKNIVLWRRDQGFWWKTCGEAKEVQCGEHA